MNYDFITYQMFCTEGDCHCYIDQAMFLHVISTSPYMTYVDVSTSLDEDTEKFEIIGIIL